MKLSEKVLKMHEMSRGILVVDENLASIIQALRERNIKIISPESGMSDAKIKQLLLSKRVFVTNNPKDFISDASSYEYGIISTDKIKSKDPSSLAKIISDALVKHSLWSKQHGFIFVLKEDGKHEFKELVE